MTQFPGPKRRPDDTGGVPLDVFTAKSFIDAVNRLADILSQPMVKPEITIPTEVNVTPSIVPPAVEVNVPPAQVSVRPDITVESPDINIPAPMVTVQPPLIVFAKRCRKTVHRDANGRIDYIEEEYS